MSKVRIAVAGAGMIGAAHMARAQASPTCALVAVVDPAPAARKVAAQAGVPLYPTLDALFSAVEVDGVVVASPNRFHVEQALRCIDEGVGVLLEKPVADTVAAAERLAAAVEAKGALVVAAAKAGKITDREAVAALEDDFDIAARRTQEREVPCGTYLDEEAPGETLEDAAVRREVSNVLLRVLNGLPSRQRQCVCGHRRRAHPDLAQQARRRRAVGTRARDSRDARPPRRCSGLPTSHPH